MNYDAYAQEDYVPKPWNKGIDHNGQAYYVNTETGQIRRQPPVTAGGHTYQKANAFIDPEQWDLVIETMASTIHPEQQLRIFQKLKKIAEKMITKDDPKYRTLYLNNPKLQHTVLTFDGGLEFLYNLGFEPHPQSPDRLVCNEVNSRVVQACLICLEDKIEVLSYDVSQTRHGKGSISEEPLNHSDPQLDKLQHPSMNQQQPSYGSSAYEPSYTEQSYQPPVEHQQNNGGYGGNANHANNGYHAQQQYQPQQQAQAQAYNNGGTNDKNQVLSNLGALGFAGMLQNNMHSNRSSPDMHHHAAPPQQLQHSKSDYGYQANNQQMQPSHSAHRSQSRPVPPPPMKPNNNNVVEYGNGINYKGGGYPQRDEEKIQSNVNRNLEADNKAKLEHMLGGVPKFKKMYKTIIFIRHGNSIWNRFKNAGRKKKWAAVAVGIGEFLRTKNNPSNHADTWVVDAPLSRVGIDEAYSLSRFLGRHLTLRQFESLADLEHHQALATPIKDALRIIQTDILDPYSKQLQRISPDLFAKCTEIRDIMEDAHKKIQRIMLETEAQRGNAQNSRKQKGVGHVTRGGDVIPDGDKSSKSNSLEKADSVLLQNGFDNNGYLLDDDEKKLEQEKENRLMNAPGLHKIVSHVVIPNQVENVDEQDDLEMPLELEWVLDQMVDSSNSSVVVTSNLRRAISTAVIALWDRFGANKECIHILPCLQELGMNVDTHTPILEEQVPEVSNFEKTSKKLNVNKLTEFYQTRLKVEQANQSFGKKSLRENAQDTQQRLNFFCDWAFKKNDAKGKPVQTIIACGHSHWMRAFFKNYLPKECQSMAAKRKLQNCGVVGFRMICHIHPDNKREYEIIDRSITPIYRGFV
eukprot:CAMPEP_0197025478 /NCGR_PEP_ID=MMETSP1384-20130603/5802_1 /TAXON_ID=29189 /ORGANISM="Ammonia sp." /LENGTH=857 /DNA_ID=CAMNT_0042454011 /DNA_START=130 /DNA_END=2703 /DNA_ORIENTATION=+